MCGPPPPSSSHRWGSAKRSPAGVSVTVAPDVIVRGTRAAPGPSQPARVAGCLTGWGPWAFFAVPDRPRVSCAPRGAGAHDTRGRSGTAKNAHGPHPVRQPATRAGWEGPGAARVPRTITSGATVTDTPAGVSVTVAPDVIVRGTRAAPGPSQPARVAGCLTGWGPWAFFAVPDRPRVSCAPAPRGAQGGFA